MVAGFLFQSSQEMTINFSAVVNFYSNTFLISVIWRSNITKHHIQYKKKKKCEDPDSKVHGANMGPTWVLSAPDGPHVGPMNLAITGTLARIWTLKDIPLLAIFGSILKNHDCWITGAYFNTTYWWLIARLQYLQCISNGDTAVLHQAMDMMSYHKISQSLEGASCQVIYQILKW